MLFTRSIRMRRKPELCVVKSKRASMLDADAIAFPVLTTEDEQADGNVRAHMNVIHEAGLFQGRLGFAQDDEFMVGGDFRSGLWLFGFGAGLVSSMPLRAG